MTTPMRAQDDAVKAAPLGVVTKLFDNFTDLGVFMTLARYTRGSEIIRPEHTVIPQLPLLQFGAEFSWHVTKVEPPLCVADAKGNPTPTGCWRLRNDSTGLPEPLATKRTCGPPMDAPNEVRIDTTTGATGTIVNKVYVYNGPTECTPPKTFALWDIELGLAYIQSMPFVGRDTSLHLGGSLRELPRVSIYATRNSELSWFKLKPLHLAPYFGASFGLTKLTDLRILGRDTLTQKDTTLTAPDKDFVEGGVNVGLVTDKLGTWTLPFSIFLESEYTYAPFPAINWTSEKLLRPGSPTKLDLSNFALTFGFQIGVKDAKK